MQRCSAIANQSRLHIRCRESQYDLAQHRPQVLRPQEQQTLTKSWVIYSTSVVPLRLDSTVTIRHQQARLCLTLQSSAQSPWYDNTTVKARVAVTNDDADIKIDAKDEQTNFSETGGRAAARGESHGEEKH